MHELSHQQVIKTVRKPEVDFTLKGKAIQSSAPILLAFLALCVEITVYIEHNEAAVTFYKNLQVKSNTNLDSFLFVVVMTCLLDLIFMSCVPDQGAGASAVSGRSYVQGSVDLFE